METICSVEELFGLEHLAEQGGRIAIARSEEDEQHPFYLFTCEGLLPPGDVLAIHSRRSIARRYRMGICQSEIPLQEVEVSLLLALVLSYPFPVLHTQLQALWHLLSKPPASPQPASTPEPGEDSGMMLGPAFIAAWNERLRPLLIAITIADAEYWLRGTSKESISASSPAHPSMERA